MICYKNIPLNSHAYIDDFDPRYPQNNPDDDDYYFEPEEDEEDEEVLNRKARIDLQNLYCREDYS